MQGESKILYFVSLNQGNKAAGYVQDFLTSSVPGMAKTGQTIELCCEYLSVRCI